MEKEIKSFMETYSKLQVKYGLPKLEELNNEFEVIDLVIKEKPYPSYPLRYIRRVMASHFNSWTDYLHNIVMPNPYSAILVRESQALDESQKTKVSNLMKQMMFISRLSTKLDLDKNEKSDAEFISNYFNEWQSIKKLFQELMEINLENWKKELPEDNQKYFG